VSGHPYRFPGKPTCTYIYGKGDSEVVVYEIYGGHHNVEKVWPIEDYRKAHRRAPQDLVVPLLETFIYDSDGRLHKIVRQ